MKARNIILICALTLGTGIFGATRGLAYMRSTYNGACSELGGVPGIMQSMHLLVQGTCLNNGAKCDKVNAACTFGTPPTGPGSTPGICKQQNGGCFCVPK